MKQKIEWYREVLELEPGSRVFFPLAKLLAADGQTSDAILALRQGVLRHPEHIEAHLLLVELLFMQGATSDLQTEMDKLGTLFATYPGFWKAWSEHLSATPALRDAALAMRFFAAALQGQAVSWASIIEHGLQSMLSNRESLAESPRAFAVKPTAQEESALRMATAPLVFSESAPVIEGLDEEIASLNEEFYPATASDAGAPEVFAAMPDTVEDEESEEAFSLRTRSMAEVLAEQGDLAGALDIYQELMQAAAPDEKASLEARAGELSLRMAGTTPGVSQPEEKNHAPGGESTRLVDLLESLAQRLEARAR